MIVGNGLIANSLIKIDSEKNLFFASGVSNSLETKNSEFEREFTLLKKNITENPDKKFVYFSTLSVNDQSKQDSLYVIHKLKIEKYIEENCVQFLILRIGNVVGKGGNPNTLFNYLKNQISSETEFSVHNKARRLLIDIDDIAKFLTKNNLLKNKIVNLAFPYYYDLKEIIFAIEEVTQKKAHYQEIDEGDFYKVDFGDELEYFFSELNAKKYLKILTQKYI